MTYGIVLYLIYIFLKLYLYVGLWMPPEKIPGFCYIYLHHDHAGDYKKHEA